MKKIAMCFSIVFSALTCDVFSQTYFKIPDSGLMHYLQTKFPSAMHSDTLYTNDPIVSTTDSIYIDFSWGVENLDGLQFFSSLRFLYCSGTGLNAAILTYLPPYLPGTLQHLDVHGGGIYTVPVLPNGLLYFDCSSNNIICFPEFPATITTFSIDPNPYNCLPNYISSMSASDLAMPLCQPGNPNGCQATTAVLNNKALDSQINIFPNPSQEFIKIEGDIPKDSKFEIYDLCGECVLSQAISSSDVVDVSLLKKGAYLIVIEKSSHSVKCHKTLLIQ